MLKTLTKLKSHKKNYYAFNILRDLVKTNLSIKEKDFSVEKMTLTISDLGNFDIKKFSYIHFSVRNNDIIPCLIKENSSKLPQNTTIINVRATSSNICRSNGRRYILRPTEHASAYLKLQETNL